MTEVIKRIWKYTLEVTDEQEIEMPDVLKFRHVAPIAASGYLPNSSTWEERVRSERINVWAEVDACSELRKKKFYVVGTGHSLPEVGIFVGTAVMPSGLVWHVFWETLV
jgi:hypothetical protein